MNEKKKLGPNDPCPCGSGKKYKRCCRDNAAPNAMALPAKADPATSAPRRAVTPKATGVAHPRAWTGNSPRRAGNVRRRTGQ